MVNITSFFVRFWGGKCREELILNIFVIKGSAQGNMEWNEY